MAYQVGSSCFATIQDAATAACHDFQPIHTVLPTGQILDTFCESPSQASPNSGHIRLVTYTYTNGAYSGSTVADPYGFYYKACNQPDYVDASISIGVAILTAWASLYGIWWLYKKFNGYLTWSRGDD